MGKKAAHSGESPKDRSINMMDKFITRSTNATKHRPQLPARRKDPNVPINLWPLKDQLEYWNARTEEDVFNETYTCYSIWYDEVKQRSGLYPRTFLDLTSSMDELMRNMFADKMIPKQAVNELRKRGVY